MAWVGAEREPVGGIPQPIVVAVPFQRLLRDDVMSMSVPFAPVGPRVVTAEGARLADRGSPEAVRGLALFFAQRLAPTTPQRRRLTSRLVSP